MFYVFFGDDDFSISETVAELKAKLGDVDAASEFNLTELDGGRLSLADLESAASALPFLGDRRMVVVTGMLARCNPSGGDSDRKELSDGLKRYLPTMPPSTRLIFAEPDLHKNNPVLRWAQGLDGDQAVVKEFPVPRSGELAGWLQRRAAVEGAELEPRAAQALADAITAEGRANLRLAATELNKLATHAAGEPIGIEAVRELVSPIGMESIFRLVDAMAERRGAEAATLMHEFLDAGEHPLRILAMLARQVRLLIITRDLLDAGTPPNALAGKLPVPPFVAKKLQRQATMFSLPYLIAALRRVADIDADIKQGETDAVTALDLFIASVCGVRHEPAA